jgi:hydrogenase maturation factor
MRVASVDATSGIAWCIDEAGTRSEIMTALVADVREGDLLLVHAATALTRLEAAGVPR